jgi:DNA polymerase III epsilon subunit-like protein
MEFVVIDIEGQPELSEIAIIDCQGKLIYEALSSDNSNNSVNLPNLKSLKTILIEFKEIVKRKTIISHNVNHDIEILKYSFHKVGLNFPTIDTFCTLLEAKKNWSGLESHSLEYLSKHLNLRVNESYFVRDLAHSARYDAKFTYNLYCKLMIEQLKGKPNPFESSRVDTPFQKHPDYTHIHNQEFLILESILKDIKQNINRQSQGAVVIGEPGSGKTHLMMRLANVRLSSNRLLFIRQPNNQQSVLNHIYSRILESLVQNVGSSTQLDYLFINSYRKILTENKINQKDQEILHAFENNNLDALGSEGTDRKRSYWQRIENNISSWWIKYYSLAGFDLSILKGIIKYCSYTEFNRKNITTRWLAGQNLSEDEAETIGLPNWAEQLSLETFSLEAISVLAKLSILDEPLIIVFDQLEALGLPANYELLMSFGDAIKEIFTHVPNSLIIFNMFPDRWEQFKSSFDISLIGRVSQYQIRLSQPTEKDLNEILKIKLKSINIPIEQIFSKEDLADILDQNSIRAMINRAADYYNYKVRQFPVSVIKDKVYKFNDDDKLEDQFRELKQQQSKLLEGFKELLQIIQDSNLVNLSEIKQKFESTIITTKKTDDKYVIEYLKQKKAYLEDQYNNFSIVSDADDIGKLKTIAEALNRIQPIRLTHYRLGKRVLPEHIVVETYKKNHVLGFLQMSPNTSSFASRLNNFSEIISLYPKDSFSLFRDQRLPEIKGKIAKENIQRLQNTANAKYVLFIKQDRIFLELIYQLVLDILNKDIVVDLETALKVLTTYKEWYHWLLDMFGLTSPQ